jgi:Ca2+-binding EF-hand superfamily protein
MLNRVFKKSAATTACWALWALFALAVPTALYAQDSAPNPNSKSKDAPVKSSAKSTQADVLTDAIDPFSPGKERARFLKAAGRDTELDAQEFKANGKIENGFVRSFDKWSNLIMFDRNKDQRIDWFEANAYRQAVRTAVLTAYDKDGNKKLSDDERAKANKDLAAGKLPEISKPKTINGSGNPPVGLPEPGSRSSGSGGQSSRGDSQRRRGSSGFGGSSQNREEFVKKYDKDGDGKLSDQERRDAFTAMRAESEKRRAEYIKKYDKDGDGELDEDERRAARTAAWEKWKKENPERAAEIEKKRAEFTKLYDKDGDGELSSEERREAYRARWEQFKKDNPERATEMEKRRKEFMTRFDKNGDGEINDDERKAIGEYYRNRSRDHSENGQSRGQGDRSKDGRRGENNGSSGSSRPDNN